MVFKSYVTKFSLLITVLISTFLIASCTPAVKNPYVQPTSGKPTTPESVQHVAALAFTSYVGDELEGSDDSVDDVIKECTINELARQKILKNQYSLAWGPKVHRFKDSKLDDNMMFAAWDNANEGHLVIAIRGTNFGSISDWIDEDFFVSHTVPWKYASPHNENARISEATNIGFTVLQKLGTNSNDSLLSFITNNEKIKKITITGHSLAGALAPAFALWLKDTQASWNTKKDIKFSVIPLAGATAGNAEFAKYYDTQLGQQTNRLHNPYDVVPMAWTLSDMRRVKDIYYTDTSNFRPNIIEKIALDIGISLAKNKDYTHIKASQHSTWGAINPEHTSFASQAGWQHHGGYCNALNISMLNVNSYCVSKKFCSENPSDKKCAYLANSPTKCKPL